MVTTKIFALILGLLLNNSLLKAESLEQVKETVAQQALSRKNYIYGTGKAAAEEANEEKTAQKALDSLGAGKSKLRDIAARTALDYMTKIKDIRRTLSRLPKDSQSDAIRDNLEFWVIAIKTHIERLVEYIELDKKITLKAKENEKERASAQQEARKMNHALIDQNQTEIMPLRERQEKIKNYTGLSERNPLIAGNFTTLDKDLETAWAMLPGNGTDAKQPGEAASNLRRATPVR